VTNDETGEVIDVWVESCEQPEPYDSAVSSAIGGAAFTWA